MARSGPATEVLERVSIREVAGVFRSRDVLDTAVDGLLRSGFDRADMDIVVGVRRAGDPAARGSPPRNCPRCQARGGSPLSPARTLYWSAGSFSPS
jgi:hypothetical protein